MQLKRKNPYFYVQQNEEIILSTYPDVHVQISPARLRCALLSDCSTSTASSFSSGSLITASRLAERSKSVSTIHLVQHRGEVTTKYILHSEKEYIERVSSCQSQMRMLQICQDLERKQNTLVLNLTGSNFTSVFIAHPLHVHYSDCYPQNRTVRCSE